MKQPLLALFFGLAGLAWSQSTTTATLEGTILDATKSAVVGAKIKIAGPAGTARETTSGSDGAYRFELLPAGTYSVTASMAGFETAQLQGLDLAIGRSVRADITLSPGAVTNTITVEASSPLIDIAKTDVSLNISPEQVKELPLNGRDFANLAVLAPGAKGVNSYDPTKNRIGVFGVNGSAGRNVNITINGIDNKDNTVGGPVMQIPLEAVQEAVFSTQRFSAANGRSEGAAVNVIIKSGANSPHGSLYLQARDTALNANDYFTKKGNGPKPAFSRQLYGGSFGAALVKDRTFVFFALERQREETSLPVTDIAQKELALVTSLGAKPSPTIPTPYRDQRYTGRLDHQFTPNHRLSLTHNAQGNRGLNDQSGQTNDLTAGNFTTNQLLLSSAALTSTLGARTVNTITAGYQYWNNLIDSETKVPNLAFPNNIYFGTNGNVPQQSFQRKWQVRDDLAIAMGRHSFKFGFDFVNVPKLGGFFQTPPTLNLTFQDLPSKITTDRVLYPQGFATPGAITAMSASSGNSYFKTKDARMFGLYFQDDWKVTKRLTLNLGVRWDVDSNLHGGNVQGQSRTYLALKAINNPYAAGLPKNDLNNFSPRLGFAYDLTGSSKHILRGGYGIYFGQTFINLPLFMLQQANDTVFTQTLSLQSAGFNDPNADLVPGTNVRLSQFRFGVDPLPPIPPGAANLGAGAVGRLVDPSFQNPYNHQFNLGYALQLTANDVIEVETIYVQGVREAKRQNINAIDPSAGNVRPLTAAFTAARLPALNQIIVESSIGRSRYAAMNLSYRRKLSNRFSINTNYVLSAAKAYVGGPAAFGNVAMDAKNIFNPLDYGYAPNDERHRWVASGIVRLPGGINLIPIMQWASARPYNLTQGTNWLGNGNGNGAARAVVPANAPTNYTATIPLSAAAIRAGVADGSLKVVGYNTARGIPFFGLDLKVAKVFTFREKIKLEFFSQFFNLTNRANFGNNFVGNVRSSSFGQPNGFITPSSVILPPAFAAEMGMRFSF